MTADQKMELEKWREEQKRMLEKNTEETMAEGDAIRRNPGLRRQKALEAQKPDKRLEAWNGKMDDLADAVLRSMRFARVVASGAWGRKVGAKEEDGEGKEAESEKWEAKVAARQRRQQRRMEMRFEGAHAEADAESDESDQECATTAQKRRGANERCAASAACVLL